MQYDLVFEGGGAKGMVFVGALQVFEALGHTPGRLLGTSAGAITASLLAAGYSAQEMLEGLAEKKDGRSVFTDFMAVPTPPDPESIHLSATRAFLRSMDLPFVPDRLEEKLDDRLAVWLASQASLRCLYSFIERGGWYSADHFLEWFRRRLDTGLRAGKRRAFSSLTLAQFFEETRVDLSLVASDVTAGRMLVLNHRTAPGLPLAWAVRMSMSVPLLWQEVVWEAGWGEYRGREIAGHAIVDGGLLSNFPIELFVSHDASVTNVMGPQVSENVLGMLIDETLPVPGAEKIEKLDRGLTLGELRTVQRLSNLMNTTLSARDKMIIDAFENLVVRLPAEGYGTTEFDMSEERRELLVRAGRETLQAYFERAALADPSSFDLSAGEGEARARRLADQIARKMLK